MTSSGLHLCEEVVFESPLPLWERDRMKGKGEHAYLLSQTKIAVSNSPRIEAG